jgi:hypothetical protein
MGEADWFSPDRLLENLAGFCVLYCRIIATEPDSIVTAEWQSRCLVLGRCQLPAARRRLPPTKKGKNGLHPILGLIPSGAPLRARAIFGSGVVARFISRGASPSITAANILSRAMSSNNCRANLPGDVPRKAASRRSALHVAADSLIRREAALGFRNLTPSATHFFLTLSGSRFNAWAIASPEFPQLANMRMRSTSAVVKRNGAIGARPPLPSGAVRARRSVGSHQFRAGRRRRDAVESLLFCKIFSVRRGTKLVGEILQFPVIFCLVRAAGIIVAVIIAAFALHELGILRSRQCGARHKRRLADGGVEKLGERGRFARLGRKHRESQAL